MDTKRPTCGNHDPKKVPSNIKRFVFFRLKVKDCRNCGKTEKGKKYLW
jgi:hypothetical protein